MPDKSQPRPGRNEPCHCGSGRKYKHCCLEKDEKMASAARAKAAAVAEPKRAAKPESNQPWRATTNRGYIPRARTPRKVGGS